MDGPKAYRRSGHSKLTKLRIHAQMVMTIHMQSRSSTKRLVRDPCCTVQTTSSRSTAPRLLNRPHHPMSLQCLLRPHTGFSSGFTRRIKGVSNSTKHRPMNNCKSNMTQLIRFPPIAVMARYSTSYLVKKLLTMSQ